jgi:hypothetical protein
MNDAVSHERSSLRAGRLLKAQMQHPRLGIVDILVRNISEGGMGGKCLHAVEPGEWVRIVFPCLPPAEGLIVWRMGDGFGVRFNTPVDPSGVRGPIASTIPVSGYEVPKPFRPVLECRRPALRAHC